MFISMVTLWKKNYSQTTYVVLYKCLNTNMYVIKFSLYLSSLTSHKKFKEPGGNQNITSQRKIGYLFKKNIIYLQIFCWLYLHCHSRLHFYTKDDAINHWEFPPYGLFYCHWIYISRYVNFQVNPTTGYESNSACKIETEI